MLAKVLLAINLLIYYCVSAAVIRGDQNPRGGDIIEKPQIDCSILNECGGNWDCVDVLQNLYNLDCFVGEAAKKSLYYGGDKRGGLKNLQKIVLGSYLTRM